MDSQNKAGDLAGQAAAQPPVDIALTKADEPVINLPKQRLVAVHLVASENDAPCSFWVGLAPEGDQVPAKLMDYTSIGTLLTEAATRGVKDGGPLMLSDTSVVPPRYVYLLPVPKEQLIDRAQWIADLVTTVRSWSPESAGFYIAPELLESEEALDLLLALTTS
jgi:hypothetical protein